MKIEKKCIKVQTVNISSDASIQTSSPPDLVSKHSQTMVNDKSSYDVNKPLPDIFNFDLCHIAPKIRFLSRSLPNLNTILWMKPIDNDEEKGWISIELALR